MSEKLESPKKDASQKGTSKPAKSSTRDRTIARAAAVQALFQCEQSGADARDVIVQFAARRKKDASFEDGHAPGADAGLFERIVRQGWDGRAANDALAAEFLPENWSVDRLDPVLRAAFRASVGELRQGLPPQVAINEYVDVVSGFLNKDVAGMFNAVLDKASKRLAS